MTNLWLFAWIFLAIWSFLNLFTGFYNRTHTGLSLAVQVGMIDLAICGIVNCFWVFP